MGEEVLRLPLCELRRGKAYSARKLGHWFYASTRQDVAQGLCKRPPIAKPCEMRRQSELQPASQLGSGRGARNPLTRMGVVTGRLRHEAPMMETGFLWQSMRSENSNLGSNPDLRQRLERASF